MRALILAVTVLALAFAITPSAHADDLEKAKQYFRAGEQAFKNQSFAAAADNFELAYKQAPSLPEIAFSAAQAYRRQYFIDPKPEYVKRAVELYRSYLDKVKSGGRVGDAADGLAEMNRELDRLTAQGVKIAGVERAKTRIAISVVVGAETTTNKTTMTELSAMPATDTSGTTAKLDGKPAALFVPIDVEPGDHTVDVAATGYFPITEKRRVVEGSTELVEVQLKPQPAHLAITVEDGAHVAINGRPAGDSPLPAQELAAGAYVVTITHRGREPVVRDVVLTRGETKRLDVGLVHTGKRRAVPWLVGIGGGFVVVGGVATVLAFSNDSKMSNLETKLNTVGLSTAELADYRRDVSHRDNFKDAAYVLGGAALVAGAAAAALYWFDAPTVGEHAVIVPTASPSGAGVSLVGRF